MSFLGWLGMDGALVSAICIAHLAALDPRRRGMKHTQAVVRRLLVFSMFSPGVALGLANRWSDFLIWVGAGAILGWAISALANRRGDQSHR
jgi:hypothetical protein